MKIQYLKNNEINYKKYDFCIEQSEQGTVYAMSWYLDIVSPGWGLLMADNYSYVMPIPVKKKSFIKYAIQPVLSQQLGIFSLKQLTPEILNNFTEAIPFGYCSFFLNAGNVFEECRQFKLKNNYVLDLNRKYEEIKSGFSTNCLRNIKKAETEKLIFSNNTNLDIYSATLKKYSVHESLLKNLDLLIAILKKTENLGTEIWNVSGENGEILAIAPLIRWKNFMYYLAPVSTGSGKQKCAMFFLLDRFIKEKSNSNLILDFEGSMIPGVAKFYIGFGSRNIPYPVFLKTNIIYRGILYYKK